MGCETQEGERTERIDLRWRINGGEASSRRYYKPDARSGAERVRPGHDRAHSWPLAVERRRADARSISRVRRRGETRTYLRRARGESPNCAGGRTVTRDVGLHNSVRQDRVRECLPPPEAAIERRRYFTTSLAETATGG